MAAADDLIQAIEAATGRPGRRTGRHTRLLCPAHDDHNPSLDIASADDGSPLVKCRACGASLSEIAAAIGRTPSDFLPGHPEPFVATYDYTDADGRLLFQVCRSADKTFPQRQPDPSSASGWRWGLGGIERVLYRLPRVLAEAGHHGTIYIAEGEKDVHALERAGLTATTNPGGAGKWRDAYANSLRGASHVIVVADRDHAGRHHAETVAASIRLVLVDALPQLDLVEPVEGKDVADHLAHHNVAELVPVSDHTDPPDPPTTVFLDAWTFVDQTEEEQEPLLGDTDTTVIPRGGLVVLAGRPGSGKTTLVVDLALHLASGLPWPPAAATPNGRPPPPWPTPRPLRVALIENEGPREMFRAKLADKLERFPHDPREVGGWLGIQAWRWGAFSFADDDARAAAAAELDQHEIDLVIGDPLASLGPEGVGSPEDTRRFVALLRPLGLGLHRSFLFLHHFRERVEKQQDELARVSGAWGGHLDTLLTLSATNTADQVRLAYPKLRWAKIKPPGPIVLGRIWNTQGFEAVAEEGDASILEPLVYDWLAEARTTGGGRNGWSTREEIVKGVERRRTDVKKALEGAPHLFALVEGERAKALGARNKTTKLWGLSEWVQTDVAPDPADQEPPPDGSDDDFPF